MERIDLVIQELTDTLGSLQKEREAEINQTKRKFDHKIESISGTLAIMQQRAGIKSAPQTKSAPLPFPPDFPHEANNTHKAIWAMKKLGRGPMRQNRVVSYLKQYMDTSRGAIGTAMNLKNSLN